MIDLCYPHGMMDCWNGGISESVDFAIFDRKAICKKPWYATGTRPMSKSREIEGL